MVLLNTGKIAFIDWGSARHGHSVNNDHGATGESCTYIYRPPELLYDTNVHYYDPYKVDVWACAITILNLLQSQYFTNGDYSNVMTKIATNFGYKKNHTILSQLPEHSIDDQVLLNLLDKMLQVNPDDRIHSNEIPISFNPDTCASGLMHNPLTEFINRIKLTPVREQLLGSLDNASTSNLFFTCYAIDKYCATIGVNPDTCVVNGAIKAISMIIDTSYSEKCDYNIKSSAVRIMKCIGCDIFILYELYANRYQELLPLYIKDPALVLVV
jgi:serine/threonine protein kinase